ncbi:unnamed protein product [Caretta caretta]
MAWKTLMHCGKRSLCKRMNNIWHCAWPDAVQSFVGLDTIPALKQEIVKLVKDVGFEAVEEDVQELLESHAEQLTNEELIELSWTNNGYPKKARIMMTTYSRKPGV